MSNPLIEEAIKAHRKRMQEIFDTQMAENKKHTDFLQTTVKQVVDGLKERSSSLGQSDS